MVWSRASGPPASRPADAPRAVAADLEVWVWAWPTPTEERSVPAPCLPLCRSEGGADSEETCQLRRDLPTRRLGRDLPTRKRPAVGCRWTRPSNGESVRIARRQLSDSDTVGCAERSEAGVASAAAAAAAAATHSPTVTGPGLGVERLATARQRTEAARPASPPEGHTSIPRARDRPCSGSPRPRGGAAFQADRCVIHAAGRPVPALVRCGRAPRPMLDPGYPAAAPAAPAAPSGSGLF